MRNSFFFVRTCASSSLNAEIVICLSISLLYHTRPSRASKEKRIMKATGIVRRVDDLGRIVIPKEIRRTLRIREGDPLQTSLTRWEVYCFSMLDLAKRRGW